VTAAPLRGTEAASGEIEPAGVVTPAAPIYYPRAELQQSPAPIGELVPEFPAGAQVRRGRVRLRILIDERGYPDQVTVVRAEPEGVFDQSAIAAFGGVRYSPGIRNGIPVKSQLLLEVEYVDSSNARPGVTSNRNSY
jgi:protein TonB